MLTKLHKTPFPYAGGKADAAEHVWTALGDCAHYVEPFSGSLAVLLRRPHPANRRYHSETVNDVDGLLVNAQRSLQLSPEVTAAAASNPVAEADMHARHLALVRWRESRNLELLMGDPGWHDPKMGGWWIWGISCWIGSGWCSGKGPWHADANGRFVKQDRSPDREPGVKRMLPHLSDHGQGVNRPCAREPGVARQLPFLSADGRGVNHAGAREPGVDRQRPHLGNDGQGVNRPCAREPGVARQLPFLSADGQGVNQAGAREPGVGDNPCHEVTMPEVIRWFRYLSARLRHVRILNGDWRRCLTAGATKTLNVRQKSDDVCGMFLDPPYGHAADRTAGLYANDSMDVASEVRAWCVEHGDDPDYRVVLAGFDGEHNALEARGWRSVEWFRPGHLKGGMGQLGARGHRQDRERLWLSPHCLSESGSRQSSFDMFASAAE